MWSHMCVCTRCYLHLNYLYKTYTHTAAAVIYETFQ